MHDFPTELVNMVIDRLVDLPKPSRIVPYRSMSEYSTVSRQWVEGAQKYHFRFIRFVREKDLEKWRAAIEPDPSGVSRHVRQLRLEQIGTLQGFETNIGAFTRVQEADIFGCCFLHSLSDVETFSSMGSSLVRLDIQGEQTTPHLMASLLAGLPRLRKLFTFDIEVEHEHNSGTSPLNIPFFEDANSLDLCIHDYSPEKLSWIPPTARFRHLRIETSCIRHNPALVNSWLASSGESLQCLIIESDIRAGLPLNPLDLSRCTALKYLRLSVSLEYPGQDASAILPSLSSPRLSNIVLHFRSSRERKINHKDWENVDKDLSRLAKQFKAAHGGRMMEVRFSLCDWYLTPLLPLLKDDCPMPDLGKEANIVIGRSEISNDLSKDFYRLVDAES